MRAMEKKNLREDKAQEDLSEITESEKVARDGEKLVN